MGIARVMRTAAESSARVIATVSLIASGVMTVAASRERWLPCGSWEAPACLRVQDHRYDYLPPSAPWTPIGQAAQYAAVAEVLLAAAVLLLPALLFRGRLVLTGVVGAVTSGCLVLVAASTWASSQAGRPVPRPGLDAALGVWAFAWPLALVGLALLGRRAPGRPARRWRILVLIALLVASPVPQAFLAVGPFDAAPWADASAGFLALLAGSALWPATGRRILPDTAPAPGRRGADGRPGGQAARPRVAQPLTTVTDALTRTVPIGSPPENRLVEE